MIHDGDDDDEWRLALSMNLESYNRSAYFVKITAHKTNDWMNPSPNFYVPSTLFCTKLLWEFPFFVLHLLKISIQSHLFLTQSASNGHEKKNNPKEMTTKSKRTQKKNSQVM